MKRFAGAVVLAGVGAAGCARGTTASEASPAPVSAPPSATPSAGAVPALASSGFAEPRTSVSEVAERAQKSPRSVFVIGRTLYLATAAGEAKVLDRAYDGGERLARTQLSVDRKLVAFVRRVSGSELWVASTDDGAERRLLTERASAQPERNLASLSTPQFSRDGNTIFFLSDGWATSWGLHAIDVRTSSERFVVDALTSLVIPSGPYAGKLFVERHRYKTFPLEGVRAYEWCGVVDRHGATIKTVSEDETLCPRYPPEDRARVEAALLIPAGAPGMP